MVLQANFFIPFSVGPSVGTIILLIPIILLETKIFQDIALPHESFAKLLKPLILGNFLTLFLGMIAAVPFYLWEVVLMFSIGNKPDTLHRILMGIQYGFIIPWFAWGLSFWITYQIEKKVIFRWFRKDSHPKDVLQEGIFKANLATYLILTIPPIFASILGLSIMFS